ncbi:MAG: hypothetical protein O9274_15050 [Limnobacter sp.]|uniref:hypothetical protein n=1 Tax=Limnobacter sp. TaxID=2003368 RepID=UPI0022C83569|nr:hypothetical protein [Limnobacter sp.]MCZ8017018.1 hypothetical protein [Limnobacter sp.]
MSKSSKIIAALLVLGFALVVFSHGVVVPRFLWEPRLQSLKNQYPDQRIDVNRVVLALSLNPQLIITEIEIDDPARGENVQLALLRLGMNMPSSIQQGRLQINSIVLKGLAVQSQKQVDCPGFSLDCMPVLPVALAARAWQSTQVANPGFFTPQLNLHKLEIEQANFAVSNTQANQALSGKIEQLKFELGNEAAGGQFSLGWRLAIKTPETDNQLYIAMSAKPEGLQNGQVQLSQLKLDVDGKWDGFPWTGTAEQGKLVASIEQANGGQGAPFLKLSGENLRTYIRRDDLPETHQAAFSVQQFEGGLPSQNWIMNKAEWTYTHEEAQAWTFNMAYDASNRFLTISPETIEGSEGIPAELQTRELNCIADGRPRFLNDTYWAWQAGWFRVWDELPTDTLSVLLCPVQHPSAGGAFAATAASASGR